MEWIEENFPHAPEKSSKKEKKYLKIKQPKPNSQLLLVVRCAEHIAVLMLNVEQVLCRYLMSFREKFSKDSFRIHSNGVECKM